MTDTNGEFSEEILADLIKEGYSGQELKKRTSEQTGESKACS